MLFSISADTWKPLPQSPPLVSTVHLSWTSLAAFADCANVSVKGTPNRATAVVVVIRVRILDTDEPVLIL